MTGERRPPLVSIILCTFNRAEVVTRAIRSVVQQSYRKWELIIIDDGSRDGTEEILLPIVTVDDRMIYHRHPNRGLAASRNVGLSLSRGHLVTFLDSDDEYLPLHLESRVAIFQKDPSLDVLHGGFRCDGPRKKQYVSDATRPGKRIHVSNCFVAGTLMAKRTALQRVKGFREVVFADDFDLFQRLQGRFKIRKIRTPTYLYHCAGADRLCDLFEEGGTEAILKYRKEGDLLTG